MRAAPGTILSGTERVAAWEKMVANTVAVSVTPTGRLKTWAALRVPSCFRGYNDYLHCPDIDHRDIHSARIDFQKTRGGKETNRKTDLRGLKQCTLTRKL